MSYYVFCRDAAADYHLKWRGELVGISYAAEKPDPELKRVDFEPAMTLYIGAARDAREEGYWLAHLIAKSFRGVIFDESSGEYEDLVEEEPDRRVDRPATLALLLERWERDYGSGIETERAWQRILATLPPTELPDALDWSPDSETIDEARERVHREIEALKARQQGAVAPRTRPAEPAGKLDLRQLIGAMARPLRLALERAVADAARARHGQVTMPHWLLALVREPGEDTRAVAAAMGIDLDSLRKRLEAKVASEREVPSEPTFSSDILRIARAARRRATECRDAHIGSGHVLWAVFEPAHKIIAGYWQMELRDLMRMDRHDAVLAALAAVKKAQAARRPFDPYLDRATLEDMLAHLTPTAMATLDAAVKLAESHYHERITVTHWVFVVAKEAADVQLMARAVGFDLPYIVERLSGAVAAAPTGPKQPVFSDNMLAFLKEAWTFLDQEHGETRIRTGHLFWAAAATLADPSTQWGDELPVILGPGEEPLIRAALAESGSEAAEARVPVKRR